MYQIIENAGFEDENPCRIFQTLRAADNFVRRFYGKAEAERLHVQIAKILRNGIRTYEY